MIQYTAIGRNYKKYLTFDMTAYEEIWPVAEDHYGIITSAKAKELGISNQRMAAMVKSGRLTRLGHGVYQIQHHVPGPHDMYAVAVALAGEGAYLRGASVLYMLGLTPANPSVVYVGTPRRVRRTFSRGYRLRDNAPCKVMEYEGCEGIKCQCLVDALAAARSDGAVELDRIAAAAMEAKGKGLLADEECAKFQV